MARTEAPRGRSDRRARGAHRRTARADARPLRRLPASLEPLFWPNAIEELRLPERADVLFLHVLARGSGPQVRWLRRRFGDRAIRKWIRKQNGWGISAPRLAPWIDGAEARDLRQDAPASASLLSAADAPESVVRLLKSYEPRALLWADPIHRYVVVREILARGDAEARTWLWSTMTRHLVRKLVRDHRGAGLAEPERAKLRCELGLTTDDLPMRPYLGMW